MIKKLDRLQGRDVYENTALAKLNEVIDAVNYLQNHIADASKKVADRMIGCTTLDIPESYKTDQEEYNWVGCLCELWTGNSKNHRYGILKGIAKNTYKGHKTIHKYQALSMSFEYCEPVKPDDDIIYKGE